MNHHSFISLLLVFELSMLVSAFVATRQISKRGPIISKKFLTTNIYIVGKKNGAEPWITAGINEYETRLTGVMKFKTTFLKSDDDLVKSLKDMKGSVIALDEHGPQYKSVEFSKLFYKSVEKGGAKVSFIIGGFAGLPPVVKENYPLLSLSKMTWTHQMVRLLLTEQIYRAVEINKGSNYHKE